MGKYIGRSPVYGIFEKQVLNPNSIDNIFTLTYQAASAASLRVSYGGIEQEPDVDYTLGDGGKTINFGFVPQLGFRLYVIFMGRELTVPSAAGNFSIYHTALGDGVQTVFNLPISPVGYNGLIAFQDKLLSRPIQDYTVLGNVVTYAVAPTFGAELDYYILGIERTDLVTVDALSITNDKIGAMAVTADKLNLLYTPFTPVLTTFGGMTIDSQTLYTNEWYDSGRVIKLRAHFKVNLSGGDNKIRFSIPVQNNGSTNVSGNVTLSTDNGYVENGIVRWGAVDSLDIYRQFGVNYTDDEWTVEINMDYESD